MRLFLDASVLLAAAGSATGCNTDFADLLGGTFYGLRVLLPYEFLRRERAAGRLHSLARFPKEGSEPSYGRTLFLK